jgi:hypothetical protein
MIDPPTALAFSLFENKGVHALLLGSGLSSAAQIPTGWEITKVVFLNRSATRRHLAVGVKKLQWLRSAVTHANFPILI